MLTGDVIDLVPADANRSMQLSKLASSDVYCQQIERSQSLYYPADLVIMPDRQQLTIVYTGDRD